MCQNLKKLKLSVLMETTSAKQDNLFFVICQN